MKVNNRIDKAGTAIPVVLVGINPQDGYPYYVSVNEQGQVQVGGSNLELGSKNLGLTTPCSCSKTEVIFSFWKFSISLKYG